MQPTAQAVGDKQQKAASPGGAKETPESIAAYEIPTDTWHIIPIRATNAQPDILLTPHNPRSKYEKYKEAWHPAEALMTVKPRF